MANTDVLDSGDLLGILAVADADQRSQLAELVGSSLGASVLPVAADTHALADNDHGRLLRFSSAVTVTVSAGLREDFSCGWLQAGAGQITFAGVGAVLREADGYSKSEKQWSLGGLVALGADEFLLFGRLGT